MTKIRAKLFRCKRCGWEFVTRREGRPLRCGKCKSPYWDRERMAVVEGLKKIRRELEKADHGIGPSKPREPRPPMKAGIS